MGGKTMEKLNEVEEASRNEEVAMDRMKEALQHVNFMVTIAISRVFFGGFLKIAVQGLVQIVRFAIVLAPYEKKVGGTASYVSIGATMLTLPELLACTIQIVRSALKH